MTMEMREARTLVLLASERSIARVAGRLHLSPAAVFKQLKNLEQEWGVRLYEKRGRGLQLAPSTAVVLPYLREMVHLGDAARCAIEEWKGLRRGVLRIGSGPTLASYVLPDLLREFRRRHPQVDLQIQTGNSKWLLANLRAGTFDVVIVVSAGTHEDPDFETVMEWPFRIVLVSNLLKAPQRCRLHRLKAFPFVLFEKGSRIETLIDHYCHSNGFHPDVTMRFDSAEAIKAMVAMGLGLSMLPLWCVRADLRSGALHLIRQREQPLVARFSLVCRRTAVSSQAVQALIQAARTFVPAAAGSGADGEDG